jgi:hypothetical protein
MTWGYGADSLGFGSIGGRGFWLAKESLFDYPLFTPSEPNYNTNLTVVRSFDEASSLIDKTLHIGSIPRLHFAHGLTSSQRLNTIYFGAGLDVVLSHDPWINLGTFDGSTLYSHTGRTEFYKHRHAGNTVFQNVKGNFVESAGRIQIGNSGYTDVLPGLFVIEPVSGTENPNVSVYVTIKPYANIKTYWVSDSDVPLMNYDHAYGTIGHPYLRSENNPVLVDLSPGNANKHVIPGLSITFNNPSINCKTIISVGYEYVNSASELGDFGSINGHSSFYIPLAPWELQPYRAFYSMNYNSGWLPTLLNMVPDKIPSWHIYNVTGQVQEGCRFSVRPLVRLDQRNALTPFDQWFMGYDTDTALSQTSEPYHITFTNWQTGTPPRVTIVIDSSISKLIREIDPSTMEPTGVIHSTGQSLKCDGITLYRWDALGVYFVLAVGVDNASSADVYVKRGAGFENVIDYSDAALLERNWGGDQAPASRTIGGWDAIENSGTGDKYPIIFCVPEDKLTGVIQYQGYDFEFANSSVHATNEHWYNHYETITTCGNMLSEEDRVTDGESAVMVTCDDPRYFQVVPRTYIYTPDQRTGAIGDSTSQTRISMHVGVELDNVSPKLSGNVQERDGSLIIRIGNVNQNYLNYLEANGITVEND